MSTSHLYTDPETFDPNDYIKTYLSLSDDADLSATEPLLFQLLQLHEFYVATGPMLSRSGCRILEYGGGPGIVYPLISAAPYASEIVFAEYAEQNRRLAERWRSNSSDSPAADLTPLFQQVVSELENNKDKNAVPERERKLRFLISEIVTCDINESVALRDVTLPFDVVSTHFCLGGALSTVEQFVLGLKKLADLLRPGGVIVMTEVIGATSYLVGDKRLPVLHLSSIEVVRQSLQQAGFTSVSAKTLKAIPSELGDALEYAFCTAVKDYV